MLDFKQRAILTGFWEAADLLAVSECESDPMEFSDDDPGAGRPEGFAPSCIAYCEARVLAFWETWGDAIEACGDDAPTYARIGYHYYLTCERHGAGFWDSYQEGEYTALAVDKLTPACHADGEFEFYAGDDRLIYCMAQPYTEV